MNTGASSLDASPKIGSKINSSVNESIVSATYATSSVVYFAGSPEKWMMSPRTQLDISVITSRKSLSLAEI